MSQNVLVAAGESCLTALSVSFIGAGRRVIQASKAPLKELACLLARRAEHQARGYSEAGRAGGRRIALR